MIRWLKTQYARATAIPDAPAGTEQRLAAIEHEVEKLRQEMAAFRDKLNRPERGLL